MTRRVTVAAAVVVGYAALAVLLYRPFYPLAPDRLPRGAMGDPVQMSWFLEWTAQAVVHGRNPFQTSALDVPLGVNLAVNTLTPALGVLAAPITLTLGPVAAFNLLLRLSYVASASSMCFVLRRWCSWWPAAVVGGLLYGFGPYALSQGHANAHLVLLWNPLLPLLFALLDDLLVRRHRNPLVIGALLGLVAGLQALVDIELLAEAVLLALVAVVLSSAAGVSGRLGLRDPRHAARLPDDARRRPVAPAGNATGVRAGAGRLGRAALPAAVVFFVLAGWSLYELVLGRRHLNGPVQSLALLDTLRYDVLSIVIPTSEQAVRTGSLARTADRFLGGNLTENGGYLGPLLLLAFVATLWRLRAVRVVRLAALLAAISWVLSLGARLDVDGRRLAPLPGAVFAHLPLLGSIVAARFALFTDLFVAAVLAVGLDRLHGRSSPGPDTVAGPGRSGRRGATVAGVALVAVGLVSILPAGAVAEQPTGWSALAARLRVVVPRNGVVLAYPYPTSPYDAAMGWAAEDRIRFGLVGGYATVPGPAGSHQAQTAPDLVAPVAVQELLAFAAAGSRSPYPPPSRSLTGGAAAVDLGRVLRADRVDVVVDWPVGQDPGSARRLFVRTLGPATWHVGDVLIWRVGGR